MITRSSCLFLFVLSIIVLESHGRSSYFSDPSFRRKINSLGTIDKKLLGHEKISTDELNLPGDTEKHKDWKLENLPVPAMEMEEISPPIPDIEQDVISSKLPTDSRISPDQSKLPEGNEGQQREDINNSLPPIYDSEHESNHASTNSTTPLSDSLLSYSNDSTDKSGKPNLSSIVKNIQSLDSDAASKLLLDSILSYIIVANNPLEEEPEQLEEEPEQLEEEPEQLEEEPEQLEYRIVQSTEAGELLDSEMTIVEQPPLEQYERLSNPSHYGNEVFGNVSETSDEITETTATSNRQSSKTEAVRSSETNDSQIQLPEDDFMINAEQIKSNQSRIEFELIQTEVQNENLPMMEKVSFLEGFSFVSCQNSEEKLENLLNSFADFLLFRSPNFPNAYPNNVSCLYKFEIPAGRQGKLSCFHYELGPGDSLTIAGLDLPRHEITGELLTVTADEDFALEFTSDAEGASKGFACTLTALDSFTNEQESVANEVLEEHELHDILSSYGFL